MKHQQPTTRAVIYARYSSVNQREESIEGQLRDCTAFAEKNGFTVVNHRCEEEWHCFECRA